MTALVPFLSPPNLGTGVWDGQSSAWAGAAPVRTAEAAAGTRDREEVTKHHWFLFSPSSKSVNWLQSSCLLMSCGKPGGSIPLKSWQTAGIFGSCQILWALGGWSNPSITINHLSHNWPAFCLHDLCAVLDAVGVTVLSPRQCHGLIAGEKCACLWLQKPLKSSRIANQLQISQNT